MAVFNFGVCLVLVLYQLSAAYSEDPLETTDVVADSKAENDADGVRCYCNTAQCVSTGYMCRSPSDGGCYSELAPRRTHHARHGCLHHLAETENEALSRCQNSPVAGRPPPSGEHSLLLCCFRDMCNHEDSPLSTARLNFTSGDVDTNSVASERGGYNGEVWFKAATIAVPVCGALILFLLVAVAVRLLKADALLHADRKLRGGYMSPLAQNTEDVKKVWVGASSAPLLVAPGGCLVAIERAQLIDLPPSQQLCDIQR
ncbi:unnamed protein product [Diatraea saccharalis]|uniref:BMP and activin membrane-bound inhibitor homolog n=1 Tax=Diatraea saccharalis TaxID=40085 RepID=A0A9N9WBN3_9NEOP|nr:unnamed protein product [Diatraea saccharalis]